MQVVQAVIGVFHHFELAHQLHARRHLRKLYSTWPWARLKRERLARPLVSTFPWLHTPDFLLGRYLKSYPAGVSTRLRRLNLLAFDEYTRRSIPLCDAFIAISGVGLRTGQRVQQRGGVFLCDRGSTHHRFQIDLLAAEYARWNIPFAPELRDATGREEACYAAADAITVPSSVARRSFIAMGVSESKVHTIPYGVRLDLFRREPGEAPPTDSFNVLFAGQVSIRKGIPYLLQAFARLRHPRKKLVVVGAILDHIRPLLRELPTEDVTFTGSLPQPELIRLMSRSHVLMLPSVEEGLALVQAQAMACGCPVLATEATGAEDLFTDGVEGFIVSDRDVDALADRLQRLAGSPALQQQFSAAAIARVRSIGGWEEYGNRWDALLHQLTRQPPD